MKKILSIFLVSLCLCGCSSLTAHDNIINLLSAPELNENESEIVQAIADYTQRDVTLKYPKKDDSVSPVTYIDIDNDGTNEAVVFYNATSVGSNVRIAVLYSTNDGWVVSHDSEGYGTEIYDIDFERFQAGRRKNIVVGYTFADSSEKMLSVYSADGKDIIQTDTFSCQDYITCDVTGDGFADIVSAGIIADNQLVNLSVITQKGGVFTVAATHEFDTANAKVTNIAETKAADGGNAILVDYSDAYRYVHTEIYEYADDGLSQILRGDAVVKAWDMSYNLISSDVDGDRHVETPTVITDDAGGGSSVRFMEWTDFSSDEPVRKLYGICDTGDGIFIALPREWQNFITVSENDGVYSIVRTTDGETLVSFEVYTSRVPQDADDEMTVVSVGTMQIAFSFDDETADEQIKLITENIIYLK